MSPQFVDLDGDGHLDIVAGTFDGSPHWARGDGTHFSQPEQILDREGQRIVMNQFWNFDSEKWDETDRCDPDGGSPAKGHLTSAWAVDWDHDGDLDLLLGDHANGQVLLRRNEGERATPRFAVRNEVVAIAGAPLVVPGTVTTLRTIDWFGNGRQDLLVGSMGDAYGNDGDGGGVFVYPDVGAGGIELGAAVTLITAGKHGGREGPLRPDAGLYMDAVDHDGDGDLDLVVGGYSMWTPEQPKLTPEQELEAAALRERVDALWKEQAAFLQKASEDAGDPEAADWKQKYQQVFAERRTEYDAIQQRLGDANERLQVLVPGGKRESFVWLYENVTPKTSGADPDAEGPGR